MPRPSKYNNENMIRVDVKFPPSLWQNLKEQAEIVSQELNRKITRSDLVRRACERYLNELKKNPALGGANKWGYHE